jgi:hypothetical protein
MFVAYSSDHPAASRVAWRVALAAAAAGYLHVQHVANIGAAVSGAVVVNSRIYLVQQWLAHLWHRVFNADGL